MGRKFYLGSGLFLMALKYGVDQLLAKANGGSFIDPLTYLNPLLSIRLEAFGLDDDSLGLLFMSVWALPFIWIGVEHAVLGDVALFYKAGSPCVAFWSKAENVGAQLRALQVRCSGHHANRFEGREDIFYDPSETPPAGNPR